MQADMDELLGTYAQFYYRIHTYTYTIHGHIVKNL